MKQVLLQGGGAVVAEIPAPSVGKKNILVAVEYSCISVGTELAGISQMSEPLYKRALKHPQNVLLALQMVKEQGLGNAVHRIKGMLAAGVPTGYSAAGKIIAVGEEVSSFQVGDRVACAGARIANHAEIIDVPVNLAVSVPAEVSLKDASTVTLGAIALQGVRRASPTLGETFVVFGLGILGQLVCQLLQANGCSVIGIDISKTRIDLALANGMNFGLNSSEEEVLGAINRLTNGFGADGVIITAAAIDNQTLIRTSMQACRKKGRVILVGDVGLNLKREDFYQKELDFLVSTSYGPGRYDPYYEEDGLDYPISYVRWTENRNMQAYLTLLAENKIQLDNLEKKPFLIEEASLAYEALAAKEERPLLVFLKYTDAEKGLTNKVTVKNSPPKQGRIQVALIGAGGFALGMHVPNLAKLNADYQIRAVMSRTGLSARNTAIQNGAQYATTDFQKILEDEEIDLVMIATRHDLHAEMTLKALQAGKNVFVEKPLAIKSSGLEKIQEFYWSSAENKPVLMTGFNRRFSKPIRLIKQAISNRTNPMVINYLINAEQLPELHWIYGSEGGGRNIGEACHIYDLFNYLTSSKVEKISANSLGGLKGGDHITNNFSAILRYEDGSICTITYTALGNTSFPKEQLTVFVDGKVITLSDFKKLSAYGIKGLDWQSSTAQKGQFEELQELAVCLKAGGSWPITLDEQISATRISFEIEEKLRDI